MSPWWRMKNSKTGYRRPEHCIPYRRLGVIAVLEPLLFFFEIESTHADESNCPYKTRGHRERPKPDRRRERNKSRPHCASIRSAFS